MNLEWFYRLSTTSKVFLILLFLAGSFVFVTFVNVSLFVVLKYWGIL